MGLIIENISEVIETLPETLELTENQWYEFHYYVKRNVFLLQQTVRIHPKAHKIYIEEKEETHISNLFSALGYEVYNVLNSQDNGCGGDSPDFKIAGKHDVLLLLNVIENGDEHPEGFLKKRLPLLKSDGKILLITENMAQLKNRIKILLGYSIFLKKDDSEKLSYRKYTVSDLTSITTNSCLKIIDCRFANLYPAIKSEAITLKRYILKYMVYLIMKITPAAFRDTIFIAAAPDKLE